MRKLRVVLDTNVVVSAHLNAEGYERHVLDLVLAGKVQIAVSAAILDEYDGVLRRPKFGIAPRQVGRSLRLLQNAARVVRPRHRLKVSRDPTDNRFLECAEASKADYLVTGNKRHFPKQWRQTEVVNARELLEWVIPELRR
ncbi:MAG: putative toxin-antitoxin system toxin component, PIN family [Terriglobales bacterium]|jgi:putative PIN family toxin of toxin-antitoxin system